MILAASFTSLAVSLASLGYVLSVFIRDLTEAIMAATSQDEGPLRMARKAYRAFADGAGHDGERYASDHEAFALALGTLRAALEGSATS
jgi:hypothetical protein